MILHYKKDVYRIILVCILYVGLMCIPWVRLSDEARNDFNGAIYKHLAYIDVALRSTEVYELLTQSNGTYNGLSEREFVLLDVRLQQSQARSPKFREEVLENEVSELLHDLAEQQPGYAEIFITNKYGLNVAQTNYTEDYYQADEHWWHTTYNNGDGVAYYGDVSFDESANVWAIPLYLPIYAQDQEEVIGVAKVILDVAHVVDL